MSITLPSDHGRPSPVPGLRSLAVGAVRIDVPVYLAPMSGVTDLPFRRLARAQGTGMVVSEMIASQAMVRENRQTMKMAEVDGFGAPSAVQLAGCEPAVMAEAAKLADSDWTLSVHTALRRHGVMTMPFAFGRHYLTFAHDDEALESLVEGYKAAIASL